jgi:hypothetical protein
MTDADRDFIQRAQAELAARPFNTSSLFPQVEPADRLYADSQALADE